MIFNHICYKLKNPKAADALYKDVWSNINKLETFPYAYQEINQGIRKLKVKKFNIFYLIDEQNNLVNILHILYQGRDISQIVNW